MERVSFGLRGRGKRGTWRLGTTIPGGVLFWPDRVREDRQRTNLQVVMRLLAHFSWIHKSPHSLGWKVKSHLSRDVVLSTNLPATVGR